MALFPGPLTIWLPFPAHVLGRTVSRGLGRTSRGGHHHPWDRALSFLTTFVTSNTLLRPLVCLLCHQALQHCSASPGSAGPFVCFGPRSLPGADEGAWIPGVSAQSPGGNRPVSGADGGTGCHIYDCWAHRERPRSQTQACWDSDPLTFAFPKGCGFGLEREFP